MDQAVIVKTKKLFKRNLLQELLVHKGVVDMRQGLKDVHIKESGLKLAAAWDEVTASNLRNAWNKILRRDSQPDSNDKQMENDVRRLMDDFMPNHGYTPDELNRWLGETDQGWEPQTDADIVRDISGVFQNDDIEEEDCEVPETVYAAEPPSMSCTEAIETIDELMTFCESRWDFDGDQLLVLQKMKDLTIEITRNEKKGPMLL